MNGRTEMQRFKTLVHREWMQHGRGWLILSIAPPALLLLLTMLAPTLQADPLPGAQQLMTAALVYLPTLVLGFVAIAMLMQTPGLARRDEQDRSIEFWLSLPVGHSTSLAATLVTQWVIAPLLALAAGFVFSLALGSVLVWRLHGVAAWWDLPLAGMLLGSVETVARMAFGVLMAVLWLSPLLLLAMVASAWLKRWGLPVLVAGLLVAHLVLNGVYGIHVIGDAVVALLWNANRAITHSEVVLVHQGLPVVTPESAWPVNGRWLLQDAWGSVKALATPAFAMALAGSALCYWALVWRRAHIR
jgi:ABC-2 type transport system permease protein